MKILENALDIYDKIFHGVKVKKLPMFLDLQIINVYLNLL